MSCAWASARYASFFGQLLQFLFVRLACDIASDCRAERRHSEAENAA